LKSKSNALICLFVLLSITASLAFADSSDTQGAALGAADGERVWTLSEVLAERKRESSSRKVKYCQGGRFKPCVCPRFVSKAVQYRPALLECNGNAAVILSRKYLGIFSVVVRDSENRDRWPERGFGNCTAQERDVLGLNKCSAFKVQERFESENVAGDADVHCLGASGYSGLFEDVRRITAKLADKPGSTNDPLARWCLIGPDKPLN
jgi:hypothetical protein